MRGVGPRADRRRGDGADGGQGQRKVEDLQGHRAGRAAGELFTFNINPPNVNVQVPAGACKVVPGTFPLSQMVKVTEIPNNNSQVIGIKVEPPNRLVPGTINLPGGSVFVQIGSGVTEVTFTNKRTGYLEICKEGGSGSYTFWVYAGGNWYGYTIPAGSCTHAIEVPAGKVDIWEWPGNQLVSCGILSGGPQLGCNLPAGGMTVNVSPGDVSNETIAVMTNKGGRIDDPTTPTNNPN